MLVARDIDLQRNGSSILRDVSLAVRPAEVLALIGPNGAGKSSLLHVLSGAIRAGGGEILLDDRPLAEWPAAALARRRAVLPQSPVLGFPFRVEDVVMLGRSPHAGCPSGASDHAVVNAVLGATGTLHLAERLYTTLSGGERQRVQLARVLAQVSFGHDGTAEAGEARYLLLDEPTNNLDIAHQQAVMMIAAEFANAGHGVLTVLHDPNLAALHADRICVMDTGRIVTIGTPESIITEELLADVFGVRAAVLQHPTRGRPAMLPA